MGDFTVSTAGSGFQTRQAATCSTRLLEILPQGMEKIAHFF